MTSPGHVKHVNLVDGRALHLDNARGTALRVTRGLLWVTQHHDTRDIVLAAGDAWTIERQGVTVATALRASALSITGPGALRIDAHGQLLPWHERLAAWVERFDNARVGPRWAPYV